MTRDFRLDTDAKMLKVNAVGITPRQHRFNFLFWKMRNKKNFSEEMKVALIDPTLRCIDCGCKYNFQKTISCPRCSSEKSNLLENEDPWTDPLIYISLAIFTIISLSIRALVF